MHKVILTILLVFCSTTAFGAWIKLNSDEIGATYVDPHTISRTGNRVTMWSLADYNMAQVLPSGKQYLSTKTHIEFDCKEERVRLLAVYVQSHNLGKGETVYSPPQHGKWGPLAPNTKNGKLWQLGCEKK